MIIKTHKQFYQLKFGLKGLILMAQNSQLVAKDFSFLLYCGLVSQYPNITLKEIMDIIKEGDLENFKRPKLISIEKIQELYSKAIGEIGMSIEDFFKSTPEEIEMAYVGYLRKKETEGNITKLAIVSQKSEELISLTEKKEYSIGNLDERFNTFEILKINEAEIK